MDRIIPTNVIIVGAGPIGLELAATLKRARVDYIQFDAQQIGYTISWWPRNTYFFSTTERIEIAGIPSQSTTQQRMTGEEYLAYLRSVVEQLDLKVNTYEKIVDIQSLDGGYLVDSQTASGARLYFCRKLVLATGDMHSPNRLNIPGEDLPHVSHYFTDPHVYFRKRLLIVGGRNSAIEAALRCWRAGSQVTISYRRAEFDPGLVKSHLLPDLIAQIEFGNIRFLPCTLPVEITAEKVYLEQVSGPENRDGFRKDNGNRIEQPADFVLLNTGFVADMSLFEMAGVKLHGEQRQPEHNPETMETNMPGLFVAGTAAAGSQKRYTLFIENCHDHVAKIAASICGYWPEELGTVPSRRYDLPFEDIQAN
jgi:thioredoxin reductase (NADPH)